MLGAVPWTPLSSRSLIRVKLLNCQKYATVDLIQHITGYPNSSLCLLLVHNHSEGWS